MTKSAPARMLAAGHHVQHAEDAHLQAGLLAALARGGLGGVLARIHKARRKGPAAAEGLIDAAHQKDAAILLDQDGRSYFGIFKMDPPALGADRPHPAKTGFAIQRAAAARAEIYFVFARHERSEARRRNQASPPLSSAITSSPICQAGGMGALAGSGWGGAKSFKAASGVAVPSSRF